MGEIPELRFVPAEPAHLQQMFITFSEMSALNPDPHDPQAEESSSDDEDDEEGDTLFPVGQQQLGMMWNADSNDAAMEDVDDDEEEEEEEDDDDDDAAMETETNQH